MKLKVKFKAVVLAVLTCSVGFVFAQGNDSPQNGTNSQLTSAKSTQFTLPVSFMDWQKIRCLELEDYGMSRRCFKGLPPRAERVQVWEKARSEGKLDSLEKAQLSPSIQ
jgi:hypothetical protein